MDIDCTGVLSMAEFQLALKHIGVHLTTMEFDHMRAQLSRKVVVEVPESQEPQIRYREYLKQFDSQSFQMRLQSQKIWDLLVLNAHELKKQLKLYERLSYKISADIFRECAAKCGIVLSNSDFAILKVKLQEYAYVSRRSC